MTAADITQEELLFFDGHLNLLPVYIALRAKIAALCPSCEVRVHKTQISFRAPHPFCWVWFPPWQHMKGRPEHYLIVSFMACAPVDSARIAEKTEPCPGRWTHHVIVDKPEQADAELLGWIDGSMGFRNQKA